MSRTPTTWFREAALGIFIHFGHASRRGWELSWQMTGGVDGQHPAREPVGCDEYFENAFLFNPERFDAAEWADSIAATGATYAVFTTKHHDGFAMYDTQHSDYSITRATPFGRDITRELVEALRARGIRIGLYFSFPDWYHEDYPRMTDATVTKPYKIGSYTRTSSEQWERFRSHMIAQITELLTGYGEISVLWFDGEFEHTAEEWDFAAVRKLVRSLQPNCLVNDRCVGHGDFSTPEQQVPDAAPEGPWEVCLTMNESWGWTVDDHRWKSTPTIIGRFVSTITAGGNLLLNVGPQGDGTFPQQARDRLAELGRWVEQNREAVYGVGPAPGAMNSPVPLGAKTSETGTTIFAYCTLRPWDRLVIGGIPVNRISSVRVLGTGEQLNYEAVPRLPDVHAGLADPQGELEIDLPGATADSLIPVIEVQLAPLPRDL